MLCYACNDYWELPNQPANQQSDPMPIHVIVAAYVTCFEGRRGGTPRHFGVKLVDDLAFTRNAGLTGTGRD
jgi:hypothetical protein